MGSSYDAIRSYRLMLCLFAQWMKYRHEYESQKLLKEMKYVLDTIIGLKEEKDGVATYPVQPLLQVFTVTGQRIGATQDPAQLKVLTWP